MVQALWALRNGKELRSHMAASEDVKSILHATLLY